MCLFVQGVKFAVAAELQSPVLEALITAPFFPQLRLDADSIELSAHVSALAFSVRTLEELHWMLERSTNGYDGN